MAFSEAKRLELRKMERANDDRLHFGSVSLKWDNEKNDSIGFKQDNLSNLDIDLVAFLLDENVDIVDIISYSKRYSACRGVVFGEDSHHKDSEIQENDVSYTVENIKHKERIDFDLGIISKRVDYIVFGALLNQDFTFDQIKEMVVSIDNTANGCNLLEMKFKNNEESDNDSFINNEPYPAFVFASFAFLKGKRDWDLMEHYEYAIAGSFSQMITAAQNAVFEHKFALE